MRNAGSILVHLVRWRNAAKPVDVNDDGLSDVPDIKATLIHPTLYIYPSNKSSISLELVRQF